MLEVLDLRCKLDYYQRHDWPKEWIDFCKGYCQEVYEEYKALGGVISDDQQMEPSIVSSVASCDDANSSQDEFDEYMSDIYGDMKETSQVYGKLNELEEYLRKGEEVTKDPLQWWKDRQAVCPILSRVARDFLAIPGMMDTRRCTTRLYVFMEFFSE